MYGLVLEGGGAKGSYHIGAYKAILEEGIEIEGIAGTSIGALNGAMIVQGDFDICYKLWEELTSSMLLKEDDDIFVDLPDSGINLEDIKHIGRKVLGVIKSRGFSVEQFRFMLDKYIDEDRVRASNKDFGIVTFNVTDMKPMEITLEDIPYGELKDYLLASAYLPVFKFEKLGGKIYLDGGIYDNLPFKILENKGYKKLIFIRTHGRGMIRKISDDLEPIVISPSDDIGYSFTFRAETAKQNLRLGYYDALKALRHLLGTRYYIEADMGEDFALQFFLSLEESDTGGLADIVGRKYSNNTRNLFEFVLPKLASALGLREDFNYNELLVALVEKRAEELNIDRFKVYTIEELIGLLNTSPMEKKPEEDKEPSILEKIIDKVDLAANFNKEGLIAEVGEFIFTKKI